MRLLFVGLGNVGLQYTYTRHNIGFLVMDHLAVQQKISFQQRRYALVASFSCEKAQVYMIKPTTYMNNSGQAVKYWLDALQIPLGQSCLVVDDYTLPFGAMRLRAKGSHAGHNGLKSVADCLGTVHYPRLRLGLGDAFPKGGLADFVLAPFTLKEQESLPALLDQAKELLLTWCH